MVGGARAATLLLPRQQTVESEAPSTTLLRRVVPLARGRMQASPFPRAPAPASVADQQCPEPSLRGAKRRSNPERSGRTGLLRFARNDEQIKERKWNAGRRTLQCPPAYGVRGAPRKGGLRRPSASGALACRRSTHGTCGSDRTPPLSSSSRTSWDGTTEGRALPTPGRPSAAGVKDGFT
jgi:hypothetical protein